MKRKEGEMELVCFEVAFLVCCVASSSIMLVCVSMYVCVWCLCVGGRRKEERDDKREIDIVLPFNLHIMICVC